MSSTLRHPSFLFAFLSLFLFVLTARCMPVQEEGSDLRHSSVVTSGASPSEGGSSRGRQLVKRDLSINADLRSLASMLRARDEADARRQQEYLRIIGKRDFANMAARSSQQGGSDVMGLVSSEECVDCDGGKEVGEEEVEGGWAGGAGEERPRPPPLALLRLLCYSGQC